VRGLRWPVVDGKETKWRFSEGHDPYVKKGTAFQFYGNPDNRAYVYAFPYEPAAETPDKEYPMWFVTGRVLEHWHTGTMTMRVPQLRGAMPQAYVEMNRDDAKRLGIANGERVLVESRRGKLELPAWIDGRGSPPPGSLFVPFFDERLLINQVTLDEHDPFSKQPDYKKCAVRVERA
jgi:nitrate reductase NapA